MHYIADPSFQLSGQSLAVLALLSKREPDFATFSKEFRTYEIEVGTSPWYNGRERGVCLVVRRSLAHRRCLIITFGEHRNSDSIFIDAWEHDGYFLNPPTVTDFTDTAYETRYSAAHGRVDLAVEYIYEKMTDFYAAQPVHNPPQIPEIPSRPQPIRTLDLEE